MPSTLEATLARIFHDEAFQEDGTQIDAPLLALLAEYIRLFVLEAVIRANEERLQDFSESVDGIDNIVGDQVVPLKPSDAIDTRHLAKVTGLLVLDF